MGYANLLISLDHSDHEVILDVLSGFTVTQLTSVFFIDTPSPMKAAEIAEELRDKSVTFILYHINNKEGASVLSNKIDPTDRAAIKQILMEN